MKNVTHGLTMNGRIHGELKDARLSPREIIEQRLGLLDGVVRFSLSLWELPGDVPFDRIDLSSWPQEFVQAAGSATGMTLEVRRLEESGPRHYVLGRRSSDALASPMEVVIPWDGHEARVLASELFTARQAAEVFADYYKTRRVPDNLALRPLR